MNAIADMIRQAAQRLDEERAARRAETLQVSVLPQPEKPSFSIMTRLFMAREQVEKEIRKIVTDDKVVIGFRENHLFDVAKFALMHQLGVLEVHEVDLFQLATVLEERRWIDPSFRVFQFTAMELWDGDSFIRLLSGSLQSITILLR